MVVYYCPVVIAQCAEHWQLKCRKPVISFPDFLLKRESLGTRLPVTLDSIQFSQFSVASGFSRSLLHFIPLGQGSRQLLRTGRGLASRIEFIACNESWIPIFGHFKALIFVCVTLLLTWKLFCSDSEEVRHYWWHIHQHVILIKLIANLLHSIVSRTISGHQKLLGAGFTRYFQPYWSCLFGRDRLLLFISLVPRPRPAFRRLQYGNSDGKLGGAWERGYDWFTVFRRAWERQSDSYMVNQLWFSTVHLSCCKTWQSAVRQK